MMKVINKARLWLIISLIIVMLVMFSCKKQSKAQKQINNKPSNIDNDLYCSSCYISMSFAITKLKGSKMELDVLNKVGEACRDKIRHFKQYSSNHFLN